MVLVFVHRPYFFILFFIFFKWSTTINFVLNFFLSKRVPLHLSNEKGVNMSLFTKALSVYAKSQNSLTNKKFNHVFEAFINQWWVVKLTLKRRMPW